MKTELLRTIGLLAIIGLFGFALEKLVYVSLNLRLNVIFKNNYFLISLCISLLFVLLLMRFKLMRGWLRMALGLLLLAFFLLNIFIKSMFYAGYNQKIVQKFENGVFLIETNAPNFGICTKRFSITKNNFLLMNELYNIGCSSYTILDSNDSSIKLAIKTEPVVSWHNSLYDTVLVKF